MYILITRPEPDAQDLKTRLEALGCRVGAAPLIEIVFEPIAGEALTAASALVATSRNGLRALARSASLPMATTLPIFVVGPATAALAHELGFRDILEGAGTAADLVPAIVGASGGSAGPIFHLAGDHLAFDLRAALATHGIELSTLPAYRSVAAETLAPDIAAALHGREIDAVILMSPRTADVWADCIGRMTPRPDLSKVTHICLSEAVAGAVSSALPAAKVEIANRPNREEILALVKRLAAH